MRPTYPWTDFNKLQSPKYISTIIDDAIQRKESKVKKLIQRWLGWRELENRVCDVERTVGKPTVVKKNQFGMNVLLEAFLGHVGREAVIQRLEYLERENKILKEYLKIETHTEDSKTFMRPVPKQKKQKPCCDDEE